MPDKLDMIYDQVVENREAIGSLEDKVGNHMLDTEGRLTRVEERVSLRTRIGIGLAAVLTALGAAALRFL